MIPRLGLIFSVFLLCGFAAPKSIDFTNEEYDRFFKLLTSPEQQWLMKLAAWYFDANEFVISPLPVFDGIKPKLIPSNETEEDFPTSLLAQFLNGGVPKGWQREFTKWLAKEYTLKTHNFEQFRDKGYFCSEEDECDLVDLKNIGGNCCPFG